MKKLLMAGAALLMVALLFLLVPGSLSGASAEDFHIVGNTLVDYTGTAPNVSIPNGVEIIGRSAFENNQVVKKVTMPASVKTIEEYAFWGCAKLESVTLGKGLKEVSDFAFSACDKLKEVNIPKNITRIGIMAFADCTSLTEIYIPDTVTDIHSTAFDGVYHLEIQAEEFSYPDRYAIARGEKIANAPEYLKATPAPEGAGGDQGGKGGDADDSNDSGSQGGVEGSNGSDSQGGANQTPVPTPTPIPGEVIGSTTIVGNEAVVFIDNSDMDTMQGYEGLQTGGNGGYGGSYGDAGNYGSSYGDAAGSGDASQSIPIADWTYYGEEALVQIELEENVSAIGSFAFSRSGLTSVEIPEGVTRIEYAAFYHCDSLEEVVIPDTVTYIGEKAFAFTPWLESFYDGSMKLEKNSDFLIVGDGVLLAYRGNADQIEVPAEVKYIAPGALER